MSRTATKQLPMAPAPPLLPLPVFIQCRCRAWVSTRTFIHGTAETPPHWQEFPQAVSPVTGAIHHCHVRENQPLTEKD